MQLFVLCVFYAITYSTQDKRGLEESLNYYEILKYQDINFHSLSKRSTMSKLTKDVSFTVFSRNFHLILKNINSFIHPDFKVTTVDGHGNEKLYEYNPIYIFTGFIKDDPESHVEAFMEDGLLNMNIITKDDEYSIEPSWRYLPETSNHTMLAYRASDLKYDNQYFCGSVYAPGNNSCSYTSRYTKETYSRIKRNAAGKKTSCPMMLVADYKFYEGIGRKSVSVTATYIMHQLRKASHILSSTKFGKFSELSVDIKSIRVHTEPSTGSAYHYNMNNLKQWKPVKLLQYFSKSKDYVNYCLAHLFTHQNFARNVLGLAFIASPKHNLPGGLCENVWIKRKTYTYNTGFTSSINKYGRRLLSLQAYLVTTHEIAHNFGSEHDPGILKCSPPSHAGGKYIMYTFSVSGKDKNNQIFSPCSLDFIEKVMESKLSQCFEEKKLKLCGNGFLDIGEECDIGFKDSSNCCTHKCRLKPYAVCSPEIDGCCSSKCQPQPRGVICFSADFDDGSCFSDAYCDGNSTLCPRRKLKADLTPCGENGKCMEGVCRSHCELKNETACTCDTDGYFCKYCCLGKNKVCIPQDNMTLADGRPCLKGHCENGICISEEMTLVQRLWDIIKKIALSSAGNFMKDNIVGTTIILTLMIWIPACLALSCWDKNQEQM